MKNILILLIFVSAITSCSNLSVRIPDAQVRTPLVSKPNEFRIDIAAVPALQFDASKDASLRPPTFDDSMAYQTGIITTTFGIGLPNNFQVSGGITSDFGVQFNGKYQFLGADSPENDPTWTSAVYIDLNYDKRTRTGDTQSSSGNQWTGDIDLLAGGIGFSIGRKFSNIVHLYVGAAYNNFNSNSKIDQSYLSLSDVGGNYQHSANGYSYSYALGLDINVSHKVAISPTMQWSRIKAANNSREDLLYGLNVGININ